MTQIELNNAVFHMEEFGLVTISYSNKLSLKKFMFEVDKHGIRGVYHDVNFMNFLQLQT